MKDWADVIGLYAGFITGVLVGNFIVCPKLTGHTLLESLLQLWQKFH